MADHDSSKADPVERGCGKRVQGGVYAECGLGSQGLPIEAFLIDPPVPVPTALGLAPIGVKLFEHNGIWHIADWVGRQHYPNVADFIEEVRRFGLSRRLSKTLDFNKLTPESRILLAHPRAHIANFHEYADHWARVRYQRCPKPRPDHDLPDYPDMCIGVYFQDVEGGTPLEGEARVVNRTMPAFNYIAASRPAAVTPRYTLAFFASFPLTRLAVVRGENGEHETGYKNATQSGLPVELEDE